MKNCLKIVCALLCTCVFFAAGCSKEQPATKTPAGESEKPTQNPTETPAEPSAGEVDWNTAMTMLRQAMVETPQKMAVAYLGNYSSGTKLSEWFLENCPTLSQDQPFLKELSEDAILGDDGELYCIVALDENADLAVNRMGENGEVSAILHKGDGGKPLLVTANGAGFSPDTAVTLVDSNGDVVQYSLMTDGNGRLQKNDAVHDFTNYEDVVAGLYSAAKENCFAAPSKELLANTSWSGAVYVDADVTKTYNLDFFEDKVKIQWNDGIDAEDHEFIAEWSLSEKDGVCILNVNLDNLDGERTFIPLVSETNDSLYILSDYVNGDVHRDYEKLSVMLAKTVG